MDNSWPFSVMSLGNGFFDSEFCIVSILFRLCGPFHLCDISSIPIDFNVSVPLFSRESGQPRRR